MCCSIVFSELQGALPQKLESQPPKESVKADDQPPQVEKQTKNTGKYRSQRMDFGE